MTVGIIDYGVGNIGSLLNMFYRLEVEASVITDPAAVVEHDHVLLPGVGAFDVAMRELHRTGFDRAVVDHAEAGGQLLGICLGMQLLLDSSEEGELPGLGLVSGTSRKFDASGGLRVPHMGWSQVNVEQDHPVLADLSDRHRFYFVHSYRVVCDDPGDVLASTVYGDRYTSMIAKGSVVGAQFHPEKSHRFGMQLLQNWVRL
ncbi:imidazole glycerol phosphate synthase subunit HisH [Microbacterium sp. 179-I 3D3 NHS]|uniref:imidazole glycerol phosphate synthase subunit HisH n=1 Tax=unclassified Microbacterium TaxID=2609290 RepID=UPI0039A2B1B8